MKVKANRMRARTPLRYPGGKSAYAGVVGNLLAAVDCSHLVETFAGGAGLGLHLLMDGAIDRLTLIETDPALSAFWIAATTHSDELIDAFASMAPTIRQWHRCRETLADSNAGLVDLAAAVLFINRCSRSGSLRSGPVGGLNQSGALTIGARFYPGTIARRLWDIGERSQDITVVTGDGLAAPLREWPCGTALFVDPPYVGQGRKLYRHALDGRGHHDLAMALRGCETPWVLTYDNEPLVRDLYQGLPLTEVSVTSTMSSPTPKTELLISPLLTHPRIPRTVTT